MREEIRHARIHHRPRIQKKWDKRFGVSVLTYDDNDEIVSWGFYLRAKKVRSSKVKAKSCEK